MIIRKFCVFYFLGLWKYCNPELASFFFTFSDPMPIGLSPPAQQPVAMLLPPLHILP